MNKKKILIGTAAVAMLSLLMVGSASACVGPGLTPGFWKHNVGVYLTAQGVLTGHDAVNGAYSDPGTTGIPTWLGAGNYNPTLCTKANMELWLSWWTDAELLDLYNDLCTIGGGAAGAATRNGAANVFNTQAGLYPL